MRIKEAKRFRAKKRYFNTNYQEKKVKNYVFHAQKEAELPTVQSGAPTTVCSFQDIATTAQLVAKVRVKSRDLDRTHCIVIASAHHIKPLVHTRKSWEFCTIS